MMLCVVMGIASTSLTLTALALPSTQADVECTCQHGDDLQCPMHHRGAGAPTRCRMQRSDASAFGLVASWLHALLPAMRSTRVALAPLTVVRTGPAATPSDSIVPPDNPPPRR